MSVGLRWNLFNGFSDKARIEESKSLVRRSEAQQERAGSVDPAPGPACVRRSAVRPTAHRCGESAVAEAEESLRITQNRYQAGMNNVTDLLRTETAVLDARTRYLAAIHDQRIAATMLNWRHGHPERGFGGFELDDEDECSCFRSSGRLAGRLRRCAREAGSPP